MQTRCEYNEAVTEYLNIT